MASTWVYLARHGEVLHAAEGRFFGTWTSPCRLRAWPRRRPSGSASARSRSRPSTRATSFAPSSRRRRCRRPEDRLAVPPLREMAMGRWEGLTSAEIRAREPELCDRWLADPFAMPFPDGESLADLRARAVPAFRRVVERHAGRRIAVIAHGGTNRVLLAGPGCRSATSFASHRTTRRGA